MAGYRQNLSDIYTGITEGKHHASDKKLSDMYSEVLNEQYNDPEGVKRDPLGRFATGGIPFQQYSKEEDLVKLKKPDGSFIYLARDIIDTYGVTDETKSNVKDRLIQLLRFKNYRESDLQAGHFEGLIQTIIKGGQGKDLVDYLEDTDRAVNLKDSPSGNIESLASDFLSRDTISGIVGSKWTDKGGSNIGPGEIALAIIFRDVKNKTMEKEGGDLTLTIGDEKNALEVKGLQGRFGQQGGRGGVSSKGQQNVYDNLLKQYDSDESFKTAITNKRVILALRNTYDAIKNYNSTLPTSKQIDTDMFFQLINKHILGVAYEHSKNNYYLLKAAMTKTNSADSIKKALTKIYTFNYLDKHKYRYLLFINSKPPFDYHMLTYDKINDYIDNECLTVVGTGSDVGWTTDNLFPSMTFNFGCPISG